jgi:hypothetical protein
MALAGEPLMIFESDVNWRSVLLVLLVEHDLTGTAASNIECRSHLLWRSGWAHRADAAAGASFGLFLSLAQRGHNQFTIKARPSNATRGLDRTD